MIFTKDYIHHLLCLKIVVNILMFKIFPIIMKLLKISVELNSKKTYTQMNKHCPTIKKRKKETLSIYKQTLGDRILLNLRVLLYIICMTQMESWVLQNHNNPIHGKMRKKRKLTMGLIKRLQFVIYILQMENKVLAYDCYETSSEKDINYRSTT